MAQTPPGLPPPPPALDSANHGLPVVDPTSVVANAAAAFHVVQQAADGAEGGPVAFRVLQ
jgi:hypothetical protein